MLQTKKINNGVVAVAYDPTQILVRNSGKAHYGSELALVQIKDGKVILNESVARDFGLTIDVIKRDIMKIAGEAFDLMDWIRGAESGGVDPVRVWLESEQEGDKVSVKWVWKETGGLSDCVYHSTDTDCHTDVFELNGNVLTLNGKTDIFGSVWLGECIGKIDRFYQKWGLSREQRGSCMNTRITYLYRDASNYKELTEIVIRGEITEEQKRTIIDCLDMGEYFIPEQLGLPAKRFDKVTEDDHCWCELTYESFEPTDAEPTVRIGVNGLVEKFEAARNNWDDVKYFLQMIENAS